MIRIKVVRAGEVAVAAAVLLLLAVLAALLFQSLAGEEAVSASTSAQAGDDAAVFYWLGSGSAALRAGTAVAAQGGEAELAQSAFSVSVVEPNAAPLFGVDALRVSGEKLSPVEGAPRVLIYHTHTYEAYTMEPGMEYLETERWRTADSRYNIVRVGEALAQALRDRGIDAVHDRTDHEVPVLATAYSRSLTTLTSYAEQGESFDLCLDVHRDAYVEGMGASSVDAGGAQAAKILFLVGRGQNFNVRPDTEGNLRFAMLATSALNEQTPGICRDVLMKDGRYNQHCGKTAVLVEVGDNHNTLTEALNAVPLLATALADALSQQETHAELVTLSAGG